MNVLVPIGQPMGFRVPTFQLYTPSAGITHQPKSGWQPLRLSSYSNSQKMPKNWKPRNYGKNICRIICTIPYHPGNTCVSSGLHGLLFPRKPGKKKGQRPSLDTGWPLDNVTSPLRFIRTSPGCWHKWATNYGSSGGGLVHIICNCVFWHTPKVFLHNIYIIKSK